MRLWRVTGARSAGGFTAFETAARTPEEACAFVAQVIGAPAEQLTASPA